MSAAEKRVSGSTAVTVTVEIEGGWMQMPAKKACKSQAIKSRKCAQGGWLRATRAEPNLVGAVEENTPKTVAVAAAG